MGIQLFITLCLIFSSTILGALIFYALRNFEVPGAKAYLGLMISIVLYCLGYALEINQTTETGLFFSLRIEYWGISFLPAFWLLLAVRYAGYEVGWPRWFYAALFAVPTATVVLMNTNSLHHLYYSSFYVDTSGPFPMAGFDKGIWYHVNIFYMTICFFVGNLLFFRMMMNSAGRTRKQAATMFFTSIIPWTGNFVYQSGLAPYHIDIVPFTFFLVGPLFALAIFRFKMFDFVPIARHVVFDFMYDPVLVVDATGRLADYNRAAETILPGLSSQMIGNELRQILQDHPNLEDYLLPPYRAQEEIRLGKGTPSLVFQLSVIPIIGTQQREEAYVLMMHDISRQKLLLDTFQEQARMDALTGIYNRRYFMELGLKSLQHMSRYGHAFSLGIVDLDHFKSINDEHGHLVGDDVLRAAAQLFAEVLREEDILGRYGGEEFIFFLPETSPKVARTVAERLRRALVKMEISSKGQPIHIAASFGITGYEQATPGLSMKDLCKKADEALYLAKNKGRNRVEMLV